MNGASLKASMRLPAVTVNKMGVFDLTVKNHSLIQTQKTNCGKASTGLKRQCGRIMNKIIFLVKID